eukprot:s246_g12.t1
MSLGIGGMWSSCLRSHCRENDVLPRCGVLAVAIRKRFSQFSAHMALLAEEVTTGAPSCLLGARLAVVARDYPAAAGQIYGVVYREIAGSNYQYHAKAWLLR